MYYAKGKNKESLRPPDDRRTWLGNLNQIEQLTRSIFFFDFQLTCGDEGMPMGHLRNTNKLSFNRTYIKPLGTGVILPCFETGGLLIRGGQVLVTRYKWQDSPMEDQHVGGRNNRNGGNVRSFIFSTERLLEPGMHHMIIRYNCFCEEGLLGSIGILRQQEQDEGISIAWQTSWTIHGAS